MDRFWEKVDRSEPESCWPWTAGTVRDGYGAFHIAPGRRMTAHRFSWLLAHGLDDLPPSIHVLHHCDNTSCVNPDHLFVGDRGDNARDMSAKGRHANQQKSHCPAGHAYEGDNLYIRADGRRECRICRESRRPTRRAKAREGWIVEFDGNHVRFGSRSTALGAAIRHAGRHPGVEVIVRNGDREYTRARVGR